MKKLSNFIALVGGTVAILGAFFGSYAYLDSKYALASEVQKLERRLSLKELKDLYKDALENLYFFRKQSRKHPGDEDLKKKLKESEVECDLLKNQILELTKGIKQ